MYDILTIAAVADELSATLIDGRIQRIGAVDSRTIAAEIYAGGRRRPLVASADDRDARLYLADLLPSLDPALVTPFMLLLRKYVRGGVVIGIEQPPLERIVRISIAKRLLPDHERRRRGLPAESSEEAAEPPPDEPEIDDEADAEVAVDLTYVHLVVEIMGRHSNLILVDDDGLIMDSVKRVTAAMSRTRPVWPRLPYMPPPERAGLDPRRVSTAEMAALLANEANPDRPLWRALIEWLRGVSPQMAREIAFRTTGDAAVAVGAVPADAAATLARETRHLVEPLLTAAWTPRVYREREPEGEAGPVVAFSAVPMRHLAAEFDEEAVDSISRAASLAHGEAGAGPERHAQRRQRLLDRIGAARERQLRRLAALAEQRERAAEAERWRRWGETIYAWLWQIEPGQTALEVDGETIPLDAAGPKETAQRYFDQYRRAQGAAERTPELEAEVAREIAWLDQMQTLVAQATSFPELEALAAEWDAHAGGMGEAPRRRPALKRPQPLLDEEGNAVFIGRTAAQNDLVTFDLLGPDDAWLHARGVAGSHVGIRWRRPGVERPATVEAAARLAAWHSAARGSGAVEVDVAPRRHVRKIKGGRPGLVTYRNERTIAVPPAAEADLADILRPG